MQIQLSLLPLLFYFLFFLSSATSPFLSLLLLPFISPYLSSLFFSLALFVPSHPLSQQLALLLRLITILCSPHLPRLLLSPFPHFLSLPIPFPPLLPQCLPLSAFAHQPPAPSTPPILSLPHPTPRSVSLAVWHVNLKCGIWRSLPRVS